MSESTPVSLLHRLRESGDELAWARFVALYTPLMRRWASRLRASGQDSDDLAQEVLVAVVRAMPEFQYDAKRRFRGWLWTVTKNKWRELLRRRAVTNRDAVALDEQPIDDPVEATDAAEYHRYLVGRAVNLMKAEFQPTTWQAFLETTVEDRPAALVASRLGITVGAVYAAKARVLRRLRQELEGLTDWD